MTTICVVKKGENIISIEVSGHTGYDVDGEDIVCAGLSCIVQTAVLGIFQIAQVSATYQIDEDKGYLFLSIPENISDRERDICNIILNTAILGVDDLRNGYSDFIELEVKEDDVY